MRGARALAAGAPIGFAPDPRTSHECGDSRYLAIPFFDTCLALRLPDAESEDNSKLRDIDLKAGWLAKLNSDSAVAAADYKDEVKEAVWLPGKEFAAAWSEYVKTGAVSDTTRPPAATNARPRRSRATVLSRPGAASTSREPGSRCPNTRPRATAARPWVRAKPDRL